MTSFVWRALLAITLSAGGLAAGATTIAETDFGGDYSGDWRVGSLISQPVDAITGTWSGGNDYDFLTLSGLATGVQSVTLTFSAIAQDASAHSFSAGGEVLMKTSSYLYSAWEGQSVGSVHLDHGNAGPLSFTIRTAEDFGGTLYLGLYGTYGRLQYTISDMVWANANANAPLPAGGMAVPLPPSALLLGGGLVGLAVLTHGRRRTG